MTLNIDIPFVSLLGIEMGQAEEGRSELSYEPKPEHMNSFGVAHGGACMTLLDVCMARAARTQEPEMGCITIEMKTSFMRPSTGKLIGRGRLLHRTATMAFVEAMIYNAQEQVCAHATGTFKYVKRLATGPKSTNQLNVISTD